MLDAAKAQIIVTGRLGIQMPGQSAFWKCHSFERHWTGFFPSSRMFEHSIDIWRASVSRGQILRWQVGFQLVSSLSPLANELFRGILSWALTLSIVSQSSCPTHSQLVSGSLTDDEEIQKKLVPILFTTCSQTTQNLASVHSPKSFETFGLVCLFSNYFSR